MRAEGRYIAVALCGAIERCKVASLNTLSCTVPEASHKEAQLALEAKHVRQSSIFLQNAHDNRSWLKRA